MHQQQHQQQQQYMQQAHAAAAAAAAVGNQGPMAHPGPSGIPPPAGPNQGQPGSAGVNAGPYPPFAVQRRAHLAQQGLGGMGVMRPPSKSGLSFDVILSRLQGELQKSKQTGHELDTLTGAMHVIQDTLGGTLVRLLHFYFIFIFISCFFLPNVPLIILARSSSFLSFKFTSCPTSARSSTTTPCSYD